MKRRALTLCALLLAFVVVVFAGTASADPVLTAYSVAYGKPVVLVVTLPTDTTGTVTFTGGTKVACAAVPVTVGVARCSVSGLEVGSYTFTSSYAGDSKYPPSTAQVTVEVTQAAVKGFEEQAVVAAAGGSQLVHGQSARFAASGIPAGSTGTVTFSDDGATLCEAPASGGAASCESPELPSGDSTVVAQLDGDLNYLPATAKVPVDVAKTSFSLILTATSSNETAHPRVFTFTASGLPAEADGVVTFATSGSAAPTLCTAIVSGGEASCEAPVGQSGSVSVLATYGGSADYLQETSTPASITVPKSATTVVFLTPVAGATAALSSQATFSAYVSSSDADLPSFAGTVAFAIDGAAVCSAPVVHEEASCTGAVSGSGAITAAYSGSDDALSSTATIAGFSLSSVAPPPGATTSAPTTPTEPGTAAGTTTGAGAGAGSGAAAGAGSNAGGAGAGAGAGSGAAADALKLTLAAHVGALVAGSPVAVSGQGLLPGSEVVITLHSTPVTLGTIKVGPSGTFGSTLKLPAGLVPGVHHVVATGVGTNNKPVTSSAAFAVDNSGHFVAAASSSSSSASSGSPAPTSKTVYRPTADKKHVVGTFAASFALISIIGGVGIAGVAAAAGAGGSGEGRGGARGSHRHSEKVASAKVKHHKLKWEGQAPGDTSWTWRLAGWAWLDRISRVAPVKTAPAMPLGARLITDASYLRAMFGVASLVLPAAGAVLGVVAGVANGASTLPPSLGFLLGITALGTFDAAAGFIAAAAFALTVTVQGALVDAASVRMLLGLCVLWFAVPLIAGAARPLRRPVGDLDLSELWTRLADLVIASLLGAWAAQKIVGTFPALAGLKLSVVGQENTIGIVVLVLIVARFALETLCSFLYPERLATVSPEKLPYSTPNQRLASLAFRTAMFVFVAVAYLGECWELWVGAAIFAIPQVMKIYERTFPNYGRLYRLIPGGILKTVAMLFIGKWFFELFSSHVSSEHLLAYGFVVLALPAAGISVVEIVGREGESRAETWVHQLAGLGILILGVLFVFGKVS